VTNPLNPSDVQGLLRRALDEDRLETAAATQLGSQLADPFVFDPLLEAASESKNRGKGDEVSVSKNVFIPLTNLCRDRCAYCTFSKTPDSAEAKTYTLEEVASVVEGGVKTGCIEALFCLGDKPEVAYRAHREWLAERGYRTTTDHLLAGCKVALEGGLLPHTNAGILSAEEMESLRPWNASMGLMLENVSPRLREKGMPHRYAPDKDPEVRLRMHREAGELKIPFTSGMLIGIGENDAERAETLAAIRELSDTYRHIQEVIVQPFHPKPDTPMRFVATLTEREVAGWVAIARLTLGSAANVQAPPNLAANALEMLLRAGVSDWGGVSPLTVDFINPEAPWPGLAELRRRTESAGQRLTFRLPVYPEHLAQPEFFDAAMLARVREFAGPSGMAKTSGSPGQEAA
jgi:FO synthase